MKVVTLICCCCGNDTKGRQWWNRDLGFGLCSDCIDFCSQGSTSEEVKSYYGIRGIHYDLGYNLWDLVKIKESNSTNEDGAPMLYYLSFAGDFVGYFHSEQGARATAEEIVNNYRQGKV